MNSEKYNISADIQSINEHLAELKKHSPFDDEIIELIDNILQNGGKRIRPLICLLSFEMITNKERTDINYAAACAVEIIHNASLLVDDIFDKDIFRRKKKSFYLQFSTFSAISMSYSLSSLALSLAIRTKTMEVVDELVKATYNLSLSLYLEQKFREGGRKMTKDEAILLIDRKTTTLFEAASVIGTILGTASKGDIEKMKQFGTLFGRAFQLRDDVLSLTSTTEDIGKSGVWTDLSNRIQTFTVLKAMDLADDDDREILEQYYVHKKEYSIEEIKSKIVESGAIKSVKEEILKFTDDAIAILNEYPDSPPRNKLIEITKILKMDR